VSVGVYCLGVHAFHAFMCSFVCPCACVCTCVHACVRACVRACARARVCVCVCLCVCVCSRLAHVDVVPNTESQRDNEFPTNYAIKQGPCRIDKFVGCCPEGGHAASILPNRSLSISRDVLRRSMHKWTRQSKAVHGFRPIPVQTASFVRVVSSLLFVRRWLGLCASRRSGSAGGQFLSLC
jgi:hypothetical protein